MTDLAAECRALLMRWGITGTFGRRQEQIVTMLAAGKTIAEVAAALGIGAGTVESHLQRARLNATIAELRRKGERG